MDIDEIKSEAMHKAKKAFAAFFFGFFIPIIFVLGYGISKHSDNFFRSFNNAPLAVLYDFGVIVVIILFAAYLFALISYFSTKHKLKEDEKTREDNELREKMMEFLDKQNQTNK